MALYIDNNDNKMTFFGNIVYLHPCSAICGPCASRSGHKWHYAGVNKQYSLKKSFYCPIKTISNRIPYICLRNYSGSLWFSVFSIQVYFADSVNYKPLSFAVPVRVSNKCPIIGQNVLGIFVSLRVTIATV